ncbi:MAG: glycoside hydrolase family 5 protein, partial [Asticcacaulis sp.]|nr:glycoside hydrolase family 5 protein [Asticcacaulis sp.]
MRRGFVAGHFLDAQLSRKVASTLSGCACAALACLAPLAAQAEITPEAQVAAMGPGINIIGGYDPYWDGQPSTFRIDEDLQKAYDTGFRTARIPLFTFSHITADGKLDPAYVKRLDAVVAAAQKAGFTIILDEHDFDTCEKDTDACAVLLADVWYELSEHFKNAPDTVLFELLNEPHGKIDATLWNSWLSDLVGIVRETNPTRNIVIGPVSWNSRDYLDQLQLPEADRHIVVTFHYYDPFHFTHQGATWAGPEVEKLSGIRWHGEPAEVAAINADFDKVSAWSKAHNRPVLLGEYGSYNLHGKLEDRALWT